MSATHAPGPWRIEECVFPGTPQQITSTPYDFTGPDGQTYHCEGFTVCRTLGDGVLTRGTAEANARLIAAAPELLEALQSLLRQYRIERRQIFGTDQYEHQARKAIAKATGETAATVP